LDETAVGKEPTRSKRSEPLRPALGFAIAAVATLLVAQTLVEVLNAEERRVWWLAPNAALRIATYAPSRYLVSQVGG
jgi:hypothetical protein